MEYVRQIVNSSLLESILVLPFELKNREVEIFVIPVSEDKVEKESNNSLLGVFKKYADPKLRKKEKGAWKLAMEDKYGNS